MTNRRAGRSATETSLANAMHDWLGPISPGAPCGPDVEYDAEFILAFAKAEPGAEVQYGDFVEAPAPVDWHDIDRDCARLMLRTRDIRLAVLHTRCQVRIAGAQGLADGLGLLDAWLAAFADTLHPRPDVDEPSATANAVRINALHALVDGDGLLGDVRALVLARSASSRLQVRDIERALTRARPPDALTPESVAQRLEEIAAQDADVISALARAVAHLRSIVAWSDTQFGTAHLDLGALCGLLERIVDMALQGRTSSPGSLVPTAAARGQAPEERHDADATSPASPDLTSRERKDGAAIGLATRCVEAPPGAGPQSREHARDRIREVRRWFEAHEPSSPVPVLLERAESLIGKTYRETVGVVPGDWLDTAAPTDLR